MNLLAERALIEAIHGELAADDTLTDLLGGEHIYDAPPKSAAFPYILLSETRALDWSTATEPGTEHRVTLEVYSRARGRKEATQIANRVAVLINDQPLAIDGQDLVSLSVTEIVTGRLSDVRTFRARISLRAVTEPLAA
ncbi:MAG: DUF3168 domain-containing protein [Pseudomonadota bacterium]